MAAMHTLAGIPFSAEHIWTDEFDWAAVEQTSEYSVTGALLVDVVAKQAGRPVTLEGQGDQGWMTRETVSALYALAEVAGADYVLELADGRSFNVIFRPDEAPLTVRPLVRLALPADTSKYIVTLRLTEI
ncbi:hypothetical protein [Niveibacterium sp. SC-1]|uniref:hypothetical protein n=1 Tax=Niveibacterium sp. SC-1 TaxID=3135646 RepID=UPI0031204084